MKVFEVISEYCKDDSGELLSERQYVTADNDDIVLVAKHFKRHCDEYEKDFRGVREVLTIMQHIREGQI